jgi:hypothetical protein
LPWRERAANSGRIYAYVLPTAISSWKTGQPEMQMKQADHRAENMASEDSEQSHPDRNRLRGADNGSVSGI